MLNTLIGARGGGNNLLPGGQSLDEILLKMESLRETISEVNSQFKNAEMTTFVCVCIPEFLSLYETERMIQELAGYGIDTHAIVVNQLLFPKRTNECEQCNARRRMQKKYLDQIEELYDEFNVVKMPLLVDEVRGKERLERYVSLSLSLSSPSLSFSSSCRSNSSGIPISAPFAFYSFILANLAILATYLQLQRDAHNSIRTAGIKMVGFCRHVWRPL